jgi:hypothetical protein
MPWSALADFAGKAGIPVVSAVVAYVVSERMKARYRVVQLTARNSGRYYEDFAELYCSRIEIDQQISPLAIADLATDRTMAPRSRRGLRAAQRDEKTIAYQVFLAVRHSRVIGFLCVFVQLRESYVFIGYLGVRQDSDGPSDVSRRLIAAVRKRVTGVLRAPMFLFEIAPPATVSTHSRAKFRLFSTHGRQAGLVTRRLAVGYVQPDMDPESLDGATEASADLCLIAPPEVLASLDHQASLALVRSLYLDIYLGTFPEDTDTKAAYAEYLNSLYAAVASKPAGHP